MKGTKLACTSRWVFDRRSTNEFKSLLNKNQYQETVTSCRSNITGCL